MKSAKEKLVEAKILERVEKYPISFKLLNFLLNDVELHEMQDYANTVSIKRLGFNDHGPVHMRQVTNNAIKMLEILHAADIQTSLEKEEVGEYVDSLNALILAGMTHDLGMMVARQNHEEMSLAFAMKIIDKALEHIYGNDIHKKVVVRSLAIESIVGHMTTQRIHSLEAGVILIADGCDMTSGRARIPLAIHNTPKVGDIHIYSANAIKRVGIHRGSKKPIRIDIEMSSEVGFFQIEEVLLGKVNSSTAKPYIEIYAGVSGHEPKCYLD